MMRWQELLKMAVILLHGRNFYNFTFGGGTALMVLYNHRVSKDIDIFLRDPQILPYISPRLNDQAAAFCDAYDEASNYLKLIIGDQEIDFIVAPNLTGVKPTYMEFDGANIYCDAPAEIIIKKLFYRSESLKIRDIYDTAVVLFNGVDILSHRAIIAKKLDAIEARLNQIACVYDKEVVALNTRFDFQRLHPVDITKTFINDCRCVDENQIRRVQLP